MSYIAIVVFICATILGLAVIITDAIRDIMKHDSYWKARYDLEKENMTDIVKLNSEILDNTRNVIRINKELHGLLSNRLKATKPNEQTN